MRVHIGCGTVVLDGWFNVDERWFPHVHHVGAADRLGVIPDGAAEVVYASHVLEHVSHARRVRDVSLEADRTRGRDTVERRR